MERKVATFSLCKKIVELQCEIRVNWLLLRSFIQIPLKDCKNSIACKFSTITTFSSKKYKLKNLWLELKKEIRS